MSAARTGAVIVVDDRGILIGTGLIDGDDRAVDLLFDDVRIGSFWLLRDTAAAGSQRLWEWPPALRPFLDGRARVALIDHLSGSELAAQDLVIGTSVEPINVVDKQGNPLGLDKSMRLGRLFGSRTAEHLEPLLDSIDEVLEALRIAGLDPFLAYGTLLGAVRDGAFIGHDSDADIGYVSRHTHPADAILESFAVQRALVAQGYRITRYSGLAFKILVRETDGTRRGLDVFGGFLRDEILFLMGEVGHRFRPEWIFPTGTVQLEGRSFAVPAEPGRLLEAMYGPGWRVPDPAFKFETPTFAVRRLNGWFRGTRVEREAVWDPYYSRASATDAPGVSEFVQWALAAQPDTTRLVDVGCGFGEDAYFAARQGVSSVGLDYSRRAFARRARKAERRDLPVTYDWVNLTEVRSTLTTGARLALDRPDTGATLVLARHVLDATNAAGRENLLRLARMAVGDSGALYVQFVIRGRPGPMPHGTHPIDPDRFIELVVARGGRVAERYDLTSDGDSPPHLCRMVVRWDR